jgi:hypothetical protein
MSFTMKIIRKVFLPAIAILALSAAADARENGAPNGNRTNANRIQSAEDVAATCTPATSKTDLDINNVRTTIMNGGDMWWDLSTGRYEIPKGGGVHSLFASALWIGGMDVGGSLRIAAMTYRQTGNDFWPGPLDTTNASIESDVCTQFDRHWKITRKEVEDFAAWSANNADYPTYTIPEVIQSWPGNGNLSDYQGHYLAPFYDRGGDGIYNYMDGDYPGYDLTGSAGCTHYQLYGDQTLWWVFNDRGNIHSETGGASIGLEIHAQAFAFTTNDEINNMTFYSYKVINRSTYRIEDTYFGQFVDADLGDPNDDYVGCDVARGLGYTYNGDANDGATAQAGAGTYGANPPAIGIDFFEGPIADTGDQVDNDRDGMMDEPGEQIIMSKFVYYDNDFSVRGNPENATHYYNYLTGRWKDGTPLTYGGNAYGGATPCDFMFPGNSDPDGIGCGGNPQVPWDEATSNNTPADRRMVFDAGPFTLEAGAVNYVTIGAVWARAGSGGPTASVELLRTTDDKAQRLFNNCFRTLDGPTAPDITMQELDRELTLYITNEESSNNYLERYEAVDPSIVYSTLHPALANIDETYNFEGYQIFQLKDNTVTTADLYNPDKARLVAQSDITNGVTQLVNRNFDQTLQADIPQDMTLEANDDGIAHSFSIKTDAFASGDNRLVNHKTYYFVAIAYAYNRYLEYNDVTFDPNSPLGASNIGQKKPYLAGRKNIRVYTGIPHITSPEAGGTDQPANYGSGPKLTRIEGCGNANTILEITQASEEAIVAATSVNNGGTARLDALQYEGGYGPVDIKVIDPLNVPEGDFTIQLQNNPAAQTIIVPSSTWMLNQTSGIGSPRSWASDTAINVHSVYANEQIIPEIGMSVTWSQTQNPGMGNNPDRNGYLASSMTFDDPTKDFLTGIVDDESSTAYNWIRAGSQSATGVCVAEFNDRTVGLNPIDPEGNYEKMVDGRWAPYRLAAYTPLATANPLCYEAGPAWTPSNPLAIIQNRIENIANVNIVYTNDRTKWTRCCVIESGHTYQLNEGQREPFHLRAHASVDKFGRTGDGVVTNNEDDADYIAANGMGWFPGYAVNIETGERLNMAFAENSTLAADNGRDMLFNPNAREYDFNNNSQNLLWGGMHYLYVFGHNGNLRYTNSTVDPAALMGKLKDMPAYDCGQAMHELMNYDNTANSELKEVYADAMWTSIPMLDGEFADWNWGDHYASSGPVLPTEVKVRLRVAKPYKRNFNGITTANGLQPSDFAATPQNDNNPMYAFNTADLKTTTADAVSAQEALQLINVVPNPYYAYSGYEKNQYDNRIKFTNLPEKCEIKIYTVSGTQVRRFTKDSPQTYLDWDLKNQAGIPVASGLYIIHVNVPGVGEKILKWFGVMRPADLDSY